MVAIREAPISEKAFIQFAPTNGVFCAGPILLFALAAPASGADAEYLGGTIPMETGWGVLDLSHEDSLVFHRKTAGVRIAYSRVNLLEYGQQVDRRFAMAVLISPMLLLSKQRKHFLTIGYQDEMGQQQAIVLRIDKGHIRVVLASLEAKTGRRVEYQDAEARKAAGKG